MKRSVLTFCLSLSLGNPAFAEIIRTVEGVGQSHSYFKEGDEWYLHYTKLRAKAAADDDALEKCSKLQGKPQSELASYTSTCKPEPHLRVSEAHTSPTGWYWHYCTVMVSMDCVLAE